GQQPVPARIHQQAAGQQQGAGAAGGDEDALRIQAHAVALGIEAGQRLAQLWQTTGRGVAGVSGGKRRLPRGDDGFGGGEVRLADLQMDDVVAFGLQLMGAREQGHDMKGIDGAAARTEGAEHAISGLVAVAKTGDSNQPGAVRAVATVREERTPEVSGNFARFNAQGSGFPLTGRNFPGVWGIEKARGGHPCPPKQKSNKANSTVASSPTSRPRARST